MRILALVIAAGIASACGASSPFVDEEPGPIPRDSLYSALSPLPAMEFGERYLGLDGGLFGGATNYPSSGHANAGLAAAAAVQPIRGRVLLLAIGMSNAQQEFRAFEQLVGDTLDPGGERDTTRVPTTGNVSLVNGAQGGSGAEAWLLSDGYDQIVEDLEDRRLSASDVQVAWVKLANGGAVARENGLLPNANADAWVLAARCLAIMDTLAGRFPNLRQVFLSSRTFGGHAPSIDGENEPRAYETGFGIRRCILEYEGPLFVTWGPYLWDPTWPPSDFEDDGKHPSPSGEAKVAARLRAFLDTSPFTEWWRRRK